VPIKSGYLLAASGGAILLWSGVKGKQWSSVLRDLIAGKPVSSATSVPITGTSAAGLGGGGGSVSSGPVSTGKNVALGRSLAMARGWGTGANWQALNQLWTKESGWNNKAQNPSSGAYGIPQGLPPSKMGVLANPPVSSASAQIIWGLGYISGRYGNPVNAWAHEVANNWY